MLEQTKINGVCCSRSKGLATTLAELTAGEAEPISLRDYARFGFGSKDFWSFPGGIVREGIIVVPGEKTLLVRDSPLIDLRVAEQYDKAFLDRKCAIEAQIEAEFPKGKSMSSEEFERKTELRYSVDRFAFPINPKPYLEIASQDKDKKPEERRVLDIDYSKLGNKQGYDGMRFMPFKNLAKEEIFRWSFRDLAPEWAKYLYKGFGSGKHEQDYVVLIGGEELKGLFGDTPFIAPFWYSAPEKGEFGFKTGDKVYRTGFLGKMKGE
jgi:hypothetical protein